MAVGRPVKAGGGSSAKSTKDKKKRKTCCQLLEDQQLPVCTCEEHPVCSLVLLGIVALSILGFGFFMLWNQQNVRAIAIDYTKMDRSEKPGTLDVVRGSKFRRL